VADGARWLTEHQNPDGGWGEDLRSYVEPGWHGGGVHRFPDRLGAARPPGGRERENPATKNGVEWLVGNQTPTDLGRALVHRHRVPWDFSLNYHLYRHVFPLTALGRYHLGTGPAPRVQSHNRVTTAGALVCWSWRR